MASQVLAWQILPVSAPRLIKRCPKCSSEVFACSNCFRINANGQKIDVWLIYRCEKCQTTWNLTVFERIRPSALRKELYQRYAKNDDSLAIETALDPQFLKRNKAKMHSVEYEVQGPLPQTDEDVQLELQPLYPMDVGVVHALSHRLNCSVSLLRRLEQEGLLECEQGLRKAKLTRTQRILLKKGFLHRIAASDID